MSELTDDLSPAGDPLTKITNLRDDQYYESWIWDDLFLMWNGMDFAITPNPFSQQTSITYTLSEQVVVDLVVYDVTGRQVVQLASGRRDPGYYSAAWYGSDMHGRQVAAGVYFVRLIAGEFIAQDKVLLVKQIVEQRISPYCLLSVY